jgi:hypothetical protein
MRNGPLQIAILLLAALAGCRGQSEPAVPDGAGSAGPGASPAGPVQTDTLTGLYESGQGPRRNQMCMIEREGRASFGFVTWGPGEKNCSGSGPATREGDRLRLRLEGDESCTLEARIEGRRVTLPTNIPAQCQSYYCGNGAQMSGTAFDKVAGAQADAMRAVDLVGDPLCGG